MGKKVAVLIRDKDRQYEGLRSSLGLLMEFHIVSMFVLKHEIEITEEYKDNMEFIDEMEGTRFSDVQENIIKYGFKKISTEEIARLLPEYDIVIPF